MIERKKLLIFFITSLAILGLLIFYIITPLINTILLGLVFTYLVYPIYSEINKRLKMPRVSSFIVCMLFIILITLPMLLALNNLTVEIFSISNRLTSFNFETFENIECKQEGVICSLINNMLDINYIQTISTDFIKEITSKMKFYIGTVLMLIPSFILNVFIILFMMYYLLIDGKSFLIKIYNSVPIQQKHKENIMIKTKNVISGILYGNILVGAIQGLVAGIGFYIFGFNAPILWGIMTFFFSFVPMLGTAIIWFPAASYLIINSFANSDPTGIWKGVAFMLYGSLIISTIDNFIRPKLVSNKAKIHPLFVLIGIIGGIAVFNTAGIIIGPLIVGVFITIFDLFESEKDYLLEDYDEENKKKDNINVSKLKNKTKKINQKGLNKKSKINKSSKNNKIKK
jgi:predicted PurR-regulated permease PerM